MAGIRIGGLASGIDTDTMVKQMMKTYTMKVDKMKQDRQIVAWKQELYRDILLDTASIKNTYFDVLKPDTNMVSKNNYAGFDVTTANNAVGQSAGVSATASVGAVIGSYTVNVTQLATTAKIDGATRSTSESSAVFDVANWQGKTIIFEIGGISQSITIGAEDPVTLPDVAPPITPITDRATLIDDINRQISNNTSLNGTISVSAGAGAGIEFVGLSDNVKITSTSVVSEMSNLINVNKYTTKLSDLGILDGTLIFDYMDSSGVMQTNKSVAISKDYTIAQVMDVISQGTSGSVKMDFSELTNKFSIESLETGSSALLKVAGDGVTGILSKLNLTIAVGGVVPPGVDAKATITPPGELIGTDVIKSGNTFSIDGVNYTLTKVGTVNNVTVNGNAQKTYDKIKGFIDKYNELVDKIGQKTDESKQYKYLPLTDEQREDMKEDEIKQWEIKAKVGLLKGDSKLESMINSMRTAFYAEVEGAGISLREIGLSTSPVISQKGKIIIDESKLKTAIETKGGQLANLFAKQSTTYSSYSADYTSVEKDIRNKEQGIFQRINDILLDYTRTTRNTDGKKGILIEKAGIKGDITEFKSLLSEDIIKKDQKINEMIKSLAAKENKFYLQFSRLEVAMNKLNTQSSWLTQQLGGTQ